MRILRKSISLNQIQQSMFKIWCAGNDSPANGSFKVVGNSGMISVHAIPFPNGEILFYGRPAEPYGMFKIPQILMAFPLCIC